MTDLIYLKSDKLDYVGVQLVNPLHLTVPAALTAVIGPNGSGKSTLGNVLERGWNFRGNLIESAIGRRPKVKKVEFSDIYSLSGLKAEYYQQRYEATMNDEVPTVGEVLRNIHAGAVSDTAVTADSTVSTASGLSDSLASWRRTCALLGLDDAEEKKINALSSGELRKVLIANALVGEVDLLILDNPYIGLDVTSRAALNDALAALSASGMGVMLLLANPEDIPDAVECIIPMKNLQIYTPITEILSVSRLRRSLIEFFDYAVNIEAIPVPAADTRKIETVLKLGGCTVKFGDNVVIDRVDWTVGDCEFWALKGDNGSGKSTLLSLVVADNPQAYCNDIVLFDRVRGTGETIWDIKRCIGYISPERSLYFRSSLNVEKVIAQGLNDTSGSYIEPKPMQITLARKWMDLLHIKHLASRRLETLSTGERQMVMLARTFIKQPRLLILDEPFHGLDAARSRSMRSIVNFFAARAKAEPGSYPMSIIFVSHVASELPECITLTKQL